METLKNFLLPNAPTVIAACSAAEARLWRSGSRFGDWTDVVTIQNPSASSAEQELVSDRPGRSFDSFGAGRHAMAPKESAQQHELKVFAKAIADRLNQSISNNTFEHIVLLADPSLLGLLRAELSAPAERAVILAASLNPANLGLEELRNYFMET